MIGALLILIFTAGTGLLLWMTHKGPLSTRQHNHSQNPEGCCGQHTVCEKFPPVNKEAEPIYFDDEELDRFKGRTSFTPEEIDEFRDVLYTLLPHDRIPWSQSLEQRQIPLPPEIRQELIALINEG